MIKKGMVAAVSVAAIFFCVAIASAAAQDTAPPQAEATPQAQTPPHSYRLEYTLTELQAGKKTDSRQYSIIVGGGTQNARPWHGHVQIATKVYAGGTNQYLDVGTRIDSFINMRDGAQVLNTDCDVSSVASDDAKDSHPILRTLMIRNETPVMLGKAVMVGTADDPNSKQTFQLEVTVTEIK